MLTDDNDYLPEQNAPRYLALTAQPIGRQARSIDASLDDIVIVDETDRQISINYKRLNII
jgi:hypothetical protein